MVQAVEAQLQAFTHTAYQIVPYESYVSLAEKINAAAPIDGLRKTTFFTTGAEAVENAVKIARAHTGRPGVIAFGGGFHGRTYMTMALTGKVAPYKKGFGPFPGSVYHAPYPSELQGITTADSIKAIERLFKADIDASQVAAIIFEPVQGEGGFVVAPPEFVAAIRRICDEHGIVMIADEVQSGFARTGELFAMDHYAHKADLMTMAKSLAGGMPLSGVVGKAEIMDAPAPGGLGGTYAGNPLAVAAAHAVLDIIHDEQLCQRAAALGEQLRATLTDARAWCPELAEVRGLGSMIAAEFCDASTGEPSAATAQRVQKKALEQGLLLLTCGQYGNVIRFLYPLTIPQDQFVKALEIIKSVTKS
jgi:4-aminobutyrate aminotransferase